MYSSGYARGRSLWAHVTIHAADSAFDGGPRLWKEGNDTTTCDKRYAIEIR